MLLANREQLYTVVLGRFSCIVSFQDLILQAWHLAQQHVVKQVIKCLNLVVCLSLFDKHQLGGCAVEGYQVLLLLVCLGELLETLNIFEALGHIEVLICHRRLQEGIEHKVIQNGNLDERPIAFVRISVRIALPHLIFLVDQPEAVMQVVR